MKVEALGTKVLLMRCKARCSELGELVGMGG